MPRKLTTEDFIIRANKIHNKVYDYSETVYTGIKDKLKIICSNHGEFTQRADHHLTGFGCSKCSNCQQHTTESFIEKSKKLHGDKYCYNESRYKANSVKVGIKCRIHGSFKMLPYSHMNEGQGCPKCGKINSGFTKSLFIKRCSENNNGLGILYVIRCFNETESFYKVGITTKTIKARFKRDMPYDYEILKQIEKEASIIFDIEKEVLRLTSNYKYKPSLDFSGQSECFSSTDSIKQYLV